MHEEISALKAAHAALEAIISKLDAMILMSKGGLRLEITPADTVRGLRVRVEYEDRCEVMTYGEFRRR